MNPAERSGIRRLLSDRPLVFVALAGCVIPLCYALYTQQIWEDALITLRHAENFLKGEGLNYYPGRRVHGFTSALNVTLLGLGDLLTGQTSYQATLWVYRLFTIAAFSAAGVVMLQTLRKVTPQPWRSAIAFFVVCFLCDAKSVAFSANGQETAFVLLCLAGTLYLFADDQPQHWRMRGLCWAGMMYTRPDGCVYIAILGLCELLFSRGRRMRVFVSLLKSATLCAIVYLPWFAAMWWYYGSPVPNTVLAKTSTSGFWPQFLGGLDDFVPRLVTISAEVFAPLYNMFGNYHWFESDVWSRLLNVSAKSAGIFGLIYWLFPVRDRLGRMASLCFSLAVFYLSCCAAVRFPWYYPPIELFGLVALARGIPTLADAYGKRTAGGTTAELTPRPVRAMAIAIMVFLAAGQIAILPLAAWQARIQQVEVEMGNRAQIGLWLRDHAEPGQNVFLEPLGYIGYFSNLKMLDWPGLVAPEVVALRRSKRPENMTALIPDLKPDWIVIRPLEMQQIRNSATKDFFEKNYSLVKIFDIAPKLDQYSFIPGRGYVYFDSAFGVFKRNDIPFRAGSANSREGSAPAEPSP